MILGQEETSVFGAVAAVLVSVAGLLVLWWAVWSLTTRRGRERLKESRARSRARAQREAEVAAIPPTDPRFEPTRATSARDYAAHLYFAHPNDLARLGIDREQLREYRPWLFQVHGQCHEPPW